MYLLARVDRGAAPRAFAGGVYAFGPFRMAQIAHVQMVATGWMPIALWGLHRYFATRRAAWLAPFAAAWVLQALSNAYMGYFIAVPIAVVRGRRSVAIAGHRGRRAAPPGRRRPCSPARRALPWPPLYYRARTDHHQTRRTRSRAPCARRAVGVVGKNTIGAWRWLTAVGTDPERELFPGIFAIGPGALGLLTAGRVPRHTDAGRGSTASSSRSASSSRWGRSFASGGTYRHDARSRRRLLRDRARHERACACPRGSRSSSVAGWRCSSHAASTWLLRRVGAPVRDRRGGDVRGDRRRTAGPRRSPRSATAPAGAEDRGVAFWLADRAARRRAASAVHPSGDQLLDYQFVTLVHGHPIVNGFSGYVTTLVERAGIARYRRSMISNRFPAAVRMLRSLGVRYVIVHPGDYDAASRPEACPIARFAALRASGQIARRQDCPRSPPSSSRRGRAGGCGAPVTLIDWLS